VRPSDQSVDELIDAILDGTPVDWSVAAGPAAAAASCVTQLKILAAIAEFHRGAALPESEGDAALSAKSRSIDEPIAHWAHLRLLEPIGRGSFGDVYRAWDTRLHREVALKLLPADASSSETAAPAIMHEGRLLARIRHPNVVTIYGAEQISDQVGLWMEFVRGRTLEQALEQHGVFSALDVIAIGVELCGAVSAVHGAGLLHRDIKAHNVARAEDGRVVLMDFGTGRELDDEASSDLAGTPLYIAPEVLRGEPATVRSDIYSLGVLLYHLVTGSYPVNGRTVRDVRRAHQRGERTPIQAARRDVPSKFARVIERAIDPRSERRHESVDALGADLVALKPRRGIARQAYAPGVAAAILLLAGAGWQLAGRSIATRIMPTQAGDRYTNAAPDAQELCIQGYALVSRRGIPNAGKAAELFQQALEKEPEFARAHAGLALANAFMSFPFRGISFEQAYPVMRRAALEALRLDARLAEAHAAMGWVYSYEHDWIRAEKAFQQALILNPSLTQAYTSYSVSTLQPLEKYDDALRLLQTAMKRDPSSLDVQREIGEVQMFSGRYVDAAVTFRRVIDADPDFPFARGYLAKALILHGRVDEALPLLEPGMPFLGLARAYVITGRRAEAEKLAAQWEARPYWLTVAAASLGDADRVAKALERTGASEPHRIGRLLIEPELAPFRVDPRVAAIRRKFGLP
jgi:serine/threonine-protein kinase